MMLKCENCGEVVETVNEADECDQCQMAEFERQRAYWQPLYEGEKRAGLLRPQEEIDQELRDAGRGHLVRP